MYSLHTLSPKQKMPLPWTPTATRLTVYTLAFVVFMGVRHAVYVPTRRIPSLELPEWRETLCVVEDFAVTNRGERWTANVYARFVDQHEAAIIGHPVFYRPHYRSRDEANRDMALFTIGDPFECYIDTNVREGDKVPAVADFEIEWRERRVPDLFLWTGLPLYILSLLTLAMDPPIPEPRGIDELIHPKTQ